MRAAVYTRVSNNLSVYADPFAQTPTKRDMTFCFVTEDLDRDEFKVRYPRDVQGDAVDLSSLDDFCSTGDLKDWASPEKIRRAEYWHKGLRAAIARLLVEQRR